MIHVPSTRQVFSKINSFFKENIPKVLKVTVARCLLQKHYIVTYKLAYLSAFPKLQSFAKETQTVNIFFPMLVIHQEFVFLPNFTIWVARAPERRRVISGEFARAMARILAKHNRCEITMRD